MNRKMLAIMTARWLSLFGSQLHILALPILIKEFTKSSELLSLSFVAETLPWIIVSPFLITGLKKVSPLKGMASWDISRAFLVALLPFILGHTTASLAVLFLLGIFNSTYGSMRMYVMKTQTEIPIKRIVGFSLSIDDFIRLVAPPLGAILISSGLSTRTFLFIDSATFLVSALILSVFLNDISLLKSRENSSPQTGSLRAGYRALFNHPTLLPILTSETLRSFAEGILLPLALVWITDGLGYSTQLYAWSRAVGGIFGASLLLYWSAKNLPVGMKQMKFGTFSMVAGVFSLIFAKPFFFLILSSILVGTGQSLRQFVSETKIMEDSSKDGVIQSITTYNTLVASGYCAGHLAAAYLIATHEYQLGVWISLGLLMLIIAIENVRQQKGARLHETALGI